MKKTIVNIDYITITEKNINELQDRKKEKIHIIKLDFEEPTKEKILNVIDTFTKTNRYVISNSIKVYNDVLKTTGKKYYIENEKNVAFISYLRRNNKILLNIDNLRPIEQTFILDPVVLKDVTHNVEVIQMNKLLYTNSVSSVLSDWFGNLILV